MKLPLNLSKALLCTAAVNLCIFSCAAADEASDYREIIALYSQKDKQQAANSSASKYLRQYAKTPHGEMVSFILADTFSDISDRTEAFEKITNTSKSAEVREKAFALLAECLYIYGDFEKLSAVCDKYFKIFPKGKFTSAIGKLKVFSLVMTQNYADALRRTALKQDNYPFALTALAEARSSGKKDFLVKISADKSLQTSANLFLCASLFQQWGDYDRAYSAYSDIIKRFPRSPECAVAKKRLKTIQQQKPKEVADYLEIKKDIPAINAEDEVIDEPSESFYCVEIGPMYNLETARQIKKEIRKDYGKSIIVKKQREFSIYVGNFVRNDNAADMRIRLAQEMGLNGRIVYVKKEGMNEYYHEE